MGVEVQRRVDNAKGRSDLVTSAWVDCINPSLRGHFAILNNTMHLLVIRLWLLFHLSQRSLLSSDTYDITEDISTHCQSAGAPAFLQPASRLRYSES